MSIESTNTIKSYKKDLKNKVNILVGEKIRIKKSNEKHSFKKVFQKTCDCSQCGFKMRKDWGDQQIANKRENAPICMACIMGYRRKTVEQKIKDGDFQTIMKRKVRYAVMNSRKLTDK